MVGLLPRQMVGVELKQYGGTWVLPFPNELREALDLDLDKSTELACMLDEGKHGKYLAIFKVRK